MEKIIKVAIVEDLQEIATNLRDLLDEEIDISCNQVYHNAEDAINFIPKFPPDIVLCDIGLPKADGIEAIIKIRAVNPDIQFCMFTVFEDNERIFKSIKAGAKGYILKNSSPDKILKSIRDLSKGGSPINPEIARKVLDNFSAHTSQKTKKKELPITDREFELLDLLSKGLLYKEIAEELSITIGTVKQHVHKIYFKLEVNNKTEALNKYFNR